MDLSWPWRVAHSYCMAVWIGRLAQADSFTDKTVALGGVMFGIMFVWACIPRADAEARRRGQIS